MARKILNKLFEKQFAPDEVVNFNARARNAWVADKASKLKQGVKVLDAGAGECQYAPLFRHCDYKTQDFSQYSGTLSGTLAEEWRYGKIDYVCDIVNIPVPDESFDVVLCTEVLEHVPRPIETIKGTGKSAGSGWHSSLDSTTFKCNPSAALSLLWWLLAIFL